MRYMLLSEQIITKVFEENRRRHDSKDQNFDVQII